VQRRRGEAQEPMSNDAERSGRGLLDPIDRDSGILLGG
jgi:hypothetical protein